MTNTKKYLISMAVVAILGAATVFPAFAETKEQTPQRWSQGSQGGAQSDRGVGMMVRPGITGTVTAVSGTTITVAGRGFSKAPGTTVATTTYSVDASTATVKKNNATTTLSSVTVGDFVYVQGTVTGTNVIATIINDGKTMRGELGKDGNNNKGSGHATSTPVMGNGQPIIGGTVSAISGNSLTVTTKSNTQYTVDATNSRITKNGSAITVSGIVTGDTVVVQGLVNGSSITASLIVDGQSNNGVADAPGQNDKPKQNKGFMSSIGGFFMHLFGF